MEWIEKDEIAGIKLKQILKDEPENSILFEVSSKLLRQLISEGIDIGIKLNENENTTNTKR